eukprot:TRINITY_DN917_c0_g1_i8.p1 TRINITY_DN917_c0_g1~~TRINITY_DN917_c0_g1_i8.p1  ORF type:complete len:194 (+),score=34.91 TRINITY_DN917_c0_g1_i8:85-666(+)
MASLYESLRPKSEYIDRRSRLPPEDYQRKLDTSTTVYVGNLSVYTKEECIYEMFSKCGDIKKLIMGMNKRTYTPCGFCFVEYFSREDAAYAVDSLSQAKLDDRVIRVDWDIGFVEGRQYGRGKSGGQIRDEVRGYDDPERSLPFNKGNKQPFRRDFKKPDHRQGGRGYDDRRHDDDDGGERAYKRVRTNDGDF